MRDRFMEDSGQEDEAIDCEEEGEEKKEEESEEGNGDLLRNDLYEPLPLKYLIDSSMTFWCHHSPYLLKQGRVVYLEPGKEERSEVLEESLADGESEEEYGDEFGEESESESESTRESTKSSRIERETGPPLLTPLSEDTASDRQAPWTVRLSSNIEPDMAAAVIRSNVWPGAYALAVDKICSNLYIGWGHKHHAYNFNPAPMPPVEDQYVVNSEIVEIMDPSFAEEEEYRLAHLPRTPSESHEVSVGEEESESESESESENEN